MIQDSAEKGKLKNLILGRRDCHVSLTREKRCYNFVLVKYLNMLISEECLKWRRGVATICLKFILKDDIT